MAESIRNTPVIETERLILRKFTESDIGALYLILSDEEVNRFLPWYPLKSLEEAQNYYRDHYESLYLQKQGYSYAICLKQDNIPIGYIEVSLEEGNELGYGLRKEFWKRGIATEAARALIEKVKNDGIPFVIATHDRNNPGSGRVMQKLKMKYQYSYEEFWQPKKISVVFRLYQLNFACNPAWSYSKYWEESENRFVEDISQLSQTEKI